VECELVFVVSSPENRGEPFVVLIFFVVPHLSNIDILRVTMKELRDYIFMSPSTLLFISFTIVSLLVVYCMLACHIR
jgi:hypothetical protein